MTARVRLLARHARRCRQQLPGEVPLGPGDEGEPVVTIMLPDED